jgi:GTP pyrophosphokinase
LIARADDSATSGEGEFDRGGDVLAAIIGADDAVGVSYSPIMSESITTEPMLTEKFQRAFVLASKIHAKQLRKATSIPYLAHLMSVAALVLEHGGGEQAAIAGLLHDAVEDSENGSEIEESIRREFGDDVADIVLGCSDTVAVPGQSKPSWRERKTAYLEHLAAETDPDVLLVSACDKLHNVRSILGDLRTVGPAVWGRFSQTDPAAQLWYYGSLSAIYQDRVPHELHGELMRTIEEIRALAAAR